MKRNFLYERLLTSKTSLIELIIYQATDYIKSLWEKQSEKMLKEKDATLQKVEKALLKKELVCYFMVYLLHRDTNS
mgnify:CR=1 FL=1